MAKGDKNKRDASGHGRSNQSNQASQNSHRHQKSNRSKRQTGGWPSEEDLASQFDRNSGFHPEELTPSINTDERRFNLLVDSVPYMITAKPFQFNGEIRYRVSVNGGSEHVFTWDSSLGEMRAIDDEASTFPDSVEEAISEKLQSKA